MSKTEIIYCQVRKEWVAAQPEEFVRQRFLQHMIENCGFPSSLVVVEKAIDQLTHVDIKDLRNIPKRRLDIMCFMKKTIQDKEELSPLLLVECKAVPLSRRVLSQVAGYNHFIKARFIAIVNQEEIRFGWHNGNEYQFIDYLPSFSSLEQF